MNDNMEQVAKQKKALLKINTQVFSPEVEQSLRLFIKNRRTEGLKPTPSKNQQIEVLQ